MAGSFRIAEGYVEVTADESAYDRAMDRLRSKRNTVGVQLKLDDRDAIARLERFSRERSLKVKVDLDQTALSRLRMQDLTVNLIPKLQDAALNRARAQLDRLTADRVVNIRASVDTRVAAAEIKNLLQRRQVRIGVDVDTRVAADSLANLTRRRTMTVQARADTADATTSLRHLTRDRTVNVRARMLGSLAGLGGLGGNASGSAGGVGILSSRIAQLAAVVVGALPTLASLGQSIVAMGPAAAVAAPAILSLAAAFAAVKVGTSGIGDAFKAAFAPAVTSGAAAESSTRRVEAAQRSLAKAQQGVKDAEVNAAAARVQAARQIADAQQNLKDIEVNAAADRVRAARDVADAQQSLKNTVSDVADANRRAVESVAEAERDLADAQKAEKRAQEDLTQARKSAAEQLVDLNNQLVDGELDHREAVLRVQDAKAGLDKTLANPAASQRQREEAQLTYDEAVQHLKEQEIDQQRLQAQVEAANKAGVEGSEAVAKAKQGIVDADQAAIDKAKALKDAETEAAKTQVEGAQKVAKAQRDVADAQAAVAKVAKDSAEQVAKAERDVADARAGAAKAAVDGARGIADAQAAVADAARALADAQTAGASAVNKLAEAMAKLSPNAREFVNAVISQGAAWRGLKLDVQDALFRGLGSTFANLTTAVVPPLTVGLVGMARNLNAMGKNAAGAIIELSKTGKLRQMFDGLNAGFANLNRAPAQFLKGLTELSIAASPAFQRLTKAAGDAGDRISKKISDGLASGKLEESINRGIDVAKQFGALLGDIFGTVGNIMKAAAAGGGNALGALGSVFAELRRITAMPEVQQALTSIFQAVNAIAKLLAGTLGAVIQAVMPLLAALAPVVTELATKFGPVLAELATALGQALAPIIDALLPIVKDIGGVLMGIVRGLLPLLKPLGDLVGAFISAWAPMLSALGAALVPLIAALAQGLAPVVAGLVPIIKMAGQLIAGLAPMFPQLVTALLPLIPPLSQLATALLALALQVITPLMPLITGLASLLATVLAGAIGLLVPVITTVIGWLTKLADGVTKVVKWIADGFKSLFDYLVGHSIIPDMVKAIISWFTRLWTRTKEIYTALKNWVVNTWNSLWKAVTDRWSSFWNGFRTSLSSAKASVLNWVSGLKTSFTNTWSSLWSGVSSKLSSGLGVLRSKLGDFKTWMLNAVRALRDGTGNLFKGIQSGFAAPVRWVVSHVYNDGLRKMWNGIAGKISSKITLPAISLGFNKGGTVPGTGKGDIVPAMLEPGERILSNPQVAQLGGHRAIDAMLGQDRPTKTGGNPSRQEEKRRYQGGIQHFASGGIIGKVTSAIGGAVSGAADWAKDLVIGGLKSAASKALSSLVRPLINRIPGGPGIGGLLKGLAGKAVDGMMGWFGNEDKKAVGGPAVQKALSWVKTQNGLPYQWAGNGNPSWDCSGLMSAIESVIRGERPHRRWATGSFVGNSGPSGWVRNLKSPFEIGITNAGVGHTAGTLAGMNVESSGGAGVHMGKSARGAGDSMFTSRWGFAPAAKYDSGGLLQPGATMAVNATGRPERILDPQQTAMFEQLVSSGTAGGVTIENITISGTFDFSSPSSRKVAANAMVAEMKEALRLYDKARAR
jgi:phage-related protein